MTDEQHKQWCKDIAENKQLKEEIEKLEREYELFGCSKCPEFKSCRFAEKCRHCWNLGEMAREVKERQALSQKEK